MAIGDVTRIDSTVIQGCWQVDTGMYDVPNYGAVYLLEADRPALIETGIGTHYDRVFELLDRAGIARDELAYICPTHVHLDHAGGAGFLSRECPNATVAVHERGVRHLADPTRLVAGTKAAVGEQWRHYVDPEPIPETRLRSLTDGAVIDLGDRSLRAVEVPGHARHQHAFHVEDEHAIFTADAAGIYVQTTGEVKPTTPPPEFDLEQCLDDIDRLRALDPETLLYTHFGPTTDPTLLDTYRSVLIDWVKEVEDAREEAPSDDAAVDTIVDRHAPIDLWGESKSRAEVAMNARGVLGYLDR